MNHPGKIDRLPLHHSYTDLELRDACDRLEARVRTLRNSMKDEKNMKHALESIPDLVGEQDFKDLCLAIGIADGENVTGKHFAQVVREHVLTSARKSDQSREKLRQAGLV